MLASASFIRQDVVKVSLLDADGSVKTVSYMANIGGVGIDADVCRVVNVNKKLGYRGKILYVVALVRCLRKRVPVNVRIICDGKVLYHGSIFSIAFGVGKYSGGGMRQTSDAVLDDGLLDVTVIPDISLGVIARRAYRLFTSTFTQVKELTVGRGVSVEVVPEDVRPYAEVDGEVIGQAPVRFDVMPSHLNVLGVRR
jgi:diacylglycerol kinase family enzyme